uniref:protein NnrT n=1 Tax=Yoonia sp. TaxID=2212373 RepID=UPI004047458B
MRPTALIPMLQASPAFAEAFDRPIPQAQSATAEYWFGMASLALIIALVAVHLSVRRK